MQYLITKPWPWTFTAIVLGVILWLTLGKPPAPDEDVHLWEHTDKIVHAIMFGGLYYTLWFDYLRKHNIIEPRRFSWSSLLFGVFSIAVGGIVEIIQPSFNRTCDIMDFIADSAGVTVAWIVTPFFLPRFCRR